MTITSCREQMLWPNEMAELAFSWNVNLLDRLPCMLEACGEDLGTQACNWPYTPGCV